MESFATRYSALNAAQKQAVDSVEGPLVVLAGPGTGKTELLALRVANILRQTDALADNILCLTFTNSGADAIRQRLIELMGRDAYRVNIHTFHSFGSEIINTHPNYFYNGAEMRPSDELSQHQIFTEILSKLPHNNPLSKRNGDDFTQLKQVKNSISDFKRSGLIPDEIQKIIQTNEAFVDYMGADVRDFFAEKISKLMITTAPTLLKKMQAFTPVTLKTSAIIHPLSQLCADSLAEASAQAETANKTNALTAWRNNWLEKNAVNQHVFKDVRRNKTLLAASHVYSQYLSAMLAAGLYDYDDMILRLKTVMDSQPELRYDLQERYQYVLCDEFQDTNGAQMRILHSLIAGTNDGQPNVMVVGDDDQAIYRFQGAEANNIVDFQQWLDAPSLITLKDNYRSRASILQACRQVITLGENRLEDRLVQVDKSLQAHKKDQADSVILQEYNSVSDECWQIAQQVQVLSKSAEPGSIAVLARNHKHIEKLLPYLQAAGAQFSYEHSSNVFEEEPVKLLLDTAKIVTALGKGDHQTCDELLPVVLSHPAWNLQAIDLWQISLDAYNNHQPWIAAMLASNDNSLQKKLANWLIEQAQASHHLPLEYMLDTLFGSSSQPDEDFVSPLKQYFFSQEKLAKQPQTYIQYLQSLSSLRQAVREHRPAEQLWLRDVIDFVELTQQAGLKLENHHQAELDAAPVVLMSAHKAKGLEFEHVFIIGATSANWEKSGGSNSRLGYPLNMNIGPAGDSYDDHLRLFFVAMTRAKSKLTISYAATNEAGKQVFRASWLAQWQPLVTAQSKDPNQQLQSAEYNWQAPLIPRNHSDIQTSLAPLLKNYLLSATHLNNFIDITRGGPYNFLLSNLLHFPQSLSPSAALGSAVHQTLQQAGNHLSATGQQRPLEDVLYDFEANLKSRRLSQQDFHHQLGRGSDALTQFLQQRYDDFSPNNIWEFNFKYQGVTIDQARLTGMIDVISKDSKTKTIALSDYKTGKAAYSWKGKDDSEKIKLHKYRQQLLFYKLLVENSREFRGYHVTHGQLIFVEPDSQGDIRLLEMAYDKDELEQFKQLIAAVWQRIIKADFIDTSSYEQNYKGIIDFEKDLLK